jgi:uncharacterized protein YndB with AHSA1/START domain
VAADLTLDVDRVFAVDRETMWSLWTDPAHAARWMRPSLTEFGETRASIDARPGGDYRFEMHSAGETRATSGRYLAVEPPERLVYTWQWDGSPEESVVEVRFSIVGDGTRVHISHTRLASAESVAQHRDGWIGCLDSLATLVESVAEH